MSNLMECHICKKDLKDASLEEIRRVVLPKGVVYDLKTKTIVGINDNKDKGGYVCTHHNGAVVHTTLFL